MVDLVEQFREAVEKKYSRETLETMLIWAADEVERLRKALRRISNGGTAVLISATLDECPINPEVLEQIVKDALAVLPVTSTIRNSVEIVEGKQ